MKNLIINNNDNFCHWNHNYLCRSGANILALQIRLRDAVTYIKNQTQHFIILLLPFTISFPMNRINKDNVVFQICLLIFRGEWRIVAQ